MKIFIGTDHAGFKLKERLKERLIELPGYEIEDKGTLEFIPEDDYPDYIEPVCRAVLADEGSLGIIFGGSGQGEAMCANKIKGIRAAVFYGPQVPEEAVDVTGLESKDPNEIVRLARFHNNANILSIGARFVDEEKTFQAVKIFIETLFSGDERHIRRLSKFDKLGS